jgi:hypothetical protein
LELTHALALHMADQAISEDRALQAAGLQIPADVLRIHGAGYFEAWRSEGRIHGMLADSALQPV